MASATAMVATALAVVPAPPAEAALQIAPSIFTDTVDPNDGQLSLREALSIASTQSSDAEINLSPGNYEITRCGPADDLNIFGDLDVMPMGSLSIQGPATITNTCADGGVLDIRSQASVSLSDLEITGGDSTHTSKGVVHVDADGFGGGITLSGMNVHHNTSHSLIGAITLHSTNGSIDIDNSDVASNIGGGLNVDFAGSGLGTPPPSWSDFSMTDSSIVGNQSIASPRSGATTGLDSAAGNFGGTSILGADDVSITDTNVTANTVVAGQTSGSLTGSPIGGLSVAFANSTSITRSDITGNTGPSGGVHVIGSSAFAEGVTSSVTIDDTRVLGNTALNNTSFSTGGLLTLATTVNIAGSELSNNTAPGGTPTTLGTAGGAVILFPLTTTIDDTEIRSNVGGLGGIMMMGGSGATSDGTPGPGSDLTISNTAIASNIGDGPGAAGAGIARADRTTLVNVEITGNTGDALGGLSSGGRESFDATRLVITDNSSTNGVGGAMLNAGGGLTAPPADLNIVDTTVARNTGGMVGGITVGAEDVALVERSTFFRNTATQADGVGALEGTSGHVILSNATITNNNGGGVGGFRVSAPEPHVTLVASTLTWNTGNLEVTSSALTRSWATLVSTPKPGTVACTGVVHSTGDANYDTDGSCGWTGGGDVSAGPNPLIGPLRNNGGHVLTRRPDNNSPLRNAIPAQSYLCWATGDAANLVPRPTGAGCEIGAMERN